MRHELEQVLDGDSSRSDHKQLTDADTVWRWMRRAYRLVHDLADDQPSDDTPLPG